LRITATTQDNYLFYISMSEQDYCQAFFKLCRFNGVASTLKMYDDIPEYGLQGGEYHDVEISKTQTFNNQTEFLTSLGLTISLPFADIVPIDSLVIEHWHEFSIINNAFVLDYLPSIGQMTKFGRIIAIDGDYDWSQHLFTGRLIFEDTTSGS
jgi:hypothetical protein